MQRLFIQFFGAITLLLTSASASALTPVWETYASPMGVGADYTLTSGGWRVNGDKLYTVAAHSLVLMDAVSGTVRWTREIGVDATLALVADGGVAVLFDGDDASTSVLERYTPDGNRLWRRVIPRPLAEPVLIPTTLASAAIAIHYGDQPGTVVVLEADGTERWRKATGLQWYGCVAGTTGAVGCVTNGAVKVFSGIDGRSRDCALGRIFEYRAQVYVAPNSDGSLTCYSDAVGSSAYRYSAQAELIAKRVQASTWTRWFARSDGGMIAYEPRVGQPTMNVSAFSPEGIVQWRQDDVPTVEYAYGLATPTAAYFGVSGSYIRVAADGWRRLEVPFTYNGNRAITSPDGLIIGDIVPAARIAPDGSVSWWNRPSTLTDNAKGVECEPFFSITADAVAAPRFAGDPQLPPRTDLINRANGNVVTATMPIGDSLGDPHQRQQRVARDAAGHFYVVWFVGVSGNFSWTLREYGADYTLVRESEPVAAPGMYTVLSREVTVAPDGSKFVRINENIDKFDALLSRQWTYLAALRPYSPCDQQWQIPYLDGLLVHYSNGQLVRLAGDGTVVWDKVMSFVAKSFQFASDGTIYAIHQSPSGDAVSKLDRDGNVLWQSTSSLSTGPINPAEFTGFTVNPNGGVVVVGAHGPVDAREAITVSFDAAGREVFAVQLIAAGQAAFAASSVAALANGDSVVAATRLEWFASSGATAHWETATFLLAPDGATRAVWPDFDRYTRRTAGGWSLQTVEADGDVVQAGRFAQLGAYHITTNVRRVKLIPSGLRLTASASGTTFEVGQPIPLQVSLQNSLGAAAIATNSVDVWVEKVGAGVNGIFKPFQLCTIAAGSGSCTSSLVRGDRVAPTVFALYADGVIPARTAPIDVVRANVSVVARYIDPPPYQALSTITIEYEIRPGYLQPGETVRLSSSYPEPRIGTNMNDAVCGQVSDADTFPVIVRCKIPLSGPTVTISARSFDSETTNASSQITSNIAPIQKTTPSLVVEELWPQNPAPLGATVSPVVSLQVGGERTRGQVANDALLLTLGSSSCVALPIYLDPTNAYLVETGRYTCTLSLNQTGVFPLAVSFAGSSQLNALAVPTAGSVSVQAIPSILIVHPVRSLLAAATGNICTSEPGLTCQRSPDGSRSLCTTSPGWRGALYVQPTDSTFDFRHTSPPLVVGPVNGFLGTISVDNTNVIDHSACSLDLDRDGYVSPELDGLLLLRALFGVRRDALVGDLVHACSTRPSSEDIASVVAQQTLIGVLNADGAGETLATTDGLLILRYLLGLRGDALIASARGNGLVIRSANDIEYFLQATCR